MRFVLKRLPIAFRPLDMLARQASEMLVEQQFEAADRFLERALLHHPDDPALLEQHAFSAHSSSRYSVALQRWDLLRSKQPARPMAWTGVVCNLREMGRNDDAMAVAVDAFALFPKDQVLAGELLRVLQAALLPDDQRRRLLQLLNPAGLDEILRRSMLIDMELARGNLREAADLVDDLGRTYPDCSEYPIRVIDLALARCDWRRTIELAEQMGFEGPLPGRVAAALNQALHSLVIQADNARHVHPRQSLDDLQLALRHRPDNAYSVALLIDTLVKLGRLDDAESEMRQALRRFGPSDRFLNLVRARLSAKRELWEVSRSMLTDHLALFPEDWEAKELLDHVEAEWAFEQSQTAEHGTTFTAPLDVGVEENAEYRKLLLGFESLGENCEFGLVQRHFKAEPIGLFRWNSTRAETLTEALEHYLAEIGSEQYTVMPVIDGVEYFLQDSRWGFGFHTFHTKNEVAFDVLYPRMCKRLRFLRDKFLDDLRSGEKTFVFKSDDVTLDKLRRLHDALSIERRARLICVKQLARAPLPAQMFGGDVYRIEESLYVGYVKRFGLVWPQRDLQFDDWVAVCRGFADAGPPPFAPDLL